MFSRKVPFRLGDILIFLLLIFLAIFAIRKNSGRNGETVTVHAADSIYKYNLNDSGVYSVEGPIGITTIEIRNKKVRIIDSPCPNKTCIALSWGDTLICLPNKVFVTIDKKEGDFDAIAE